MLREEVSQEILAHSGNFAVIDGCLSDEIHQEFDEVIDEGLANAIEAANRAGFPNSLSAVRMYGCDTGEPAYDGWMDNRSYCMNGNFDGPDEAAEFLNKYLQTSEIMVTGAWATLDNSGWFAAKGGMRALVVVERDPLSDASFGL